MDDGVINYYFSLIFPLNAVQHGKIWIRFFSGIINPKSDKALNRSQCQSRLGNHLNSGASVLLPGSDFSSPSTLSLEQ